MFLQQFPNTENRMKKINDGYALFGSVPSILTPPEIDERASPSGYFLRPCRAPPGKSHFAQIHIFTMKCYAFSAVRGPKMGPPGATTDFATPPPGGQKSPRKSARGPPGPKQRPRDLVKGPRDPARSPPGGPGGHQGGSLRFCYTSRLILMVFSKCCCGPCFEHVIFSLNLT